MTGNVMLNAYLLYTVLRDGFKKESGKILHSKEGANLMASFEDYPIILHAVFRTASDNPAPYKIFNAQNIIEKLQSYPLTPEQEEKTQMRKLAKALQDILEIVSDPELMDARKFAYSKDVIAFSDLVDEMKITHGITYHVDISEFILLKKNVPHILNAMMLQRTFGK